MSLDNQCFRLQACLEITRLKSRYVRAIQQRKWDAWAACLTEDATAQFNPAPGQADSPIYKGKEFLRDWIPKALDGLYITLQVTTPDIEVLDEDNASGTWAAIERIQILQGNIREVVYYGYYHETYSRNVHARWKIASIRMSQIRHDIFTRDGNVRIYNHVGEEQEVST